MLNQYDSYPSVGYQQETYVVRQEGLYPPSGYKTGVPGMHMSPSITGSPPSTHYMMAEGGYPKPQEGMWSGPHKHHNEWDGKGHDPHKHGYNTGYGGYAQPHEGWSGKNKHHSDWSGKPDHYSHGYNSPGYVTGDGYGPATQPVGYGCCSTYEGQSPSKRYGKAEYWGVKDVKD
ncbi:hypothetical protein RHSIM_Rhsim12G0040000 [Rhododendron simsii]|uniref:Uncharacterized protein n=1 Tax=Rhododendron simsii TaxID=118357 RepID=A0A834G7S0_RHOSS|nr:hypothetical protein RHSIM_Rhsim12G0040000 [Rhododendron simsii]